MFVLIFTIVFTILLDLLAYWIFGGLSPRSLIWFTVFGIGLSLVGIAGIGKGKTNRKPRTRKEAREQYIKDPTPENRKQYRKLRAEDDILLIHRQQQRNRDAKKEAKRDSHHH